MHPPFCQGEGGGGPPCSGITPATALHVVSTQYKPCPSLPLQKDAIGFKEVEHQWAVRVLECLDGVGEQRVV